MADVWVQRITISSTSDPDKTYVVARKVDGTMGCNCPAWKFQRGTRGDCKHILALLREVPEWGLKKAERRTAKQLAAAKIRTETKIMGGYIFVLEEREFEPVYVAPGVSGAATNLLLDERD
jgi:uncharacterized Zn finger protein